MKTKRLLALILMVVVCISNVPLNVKAETDKDEPTPIYTIADLAGINNDPEGNYILMNDIDMTEETKKGGTWDTGHGWTPLSTFYGTFDGNGHRIIGMHIYGEVNSSEIGLFSYSWGYIKNLSMIDVDIDVTIDINKYYHYGVGAIVGKLDEDEEEGCEGKIENCYVSGNIKVSNEDDNSIQVGGIVGSSYDGEILNCYNTTSVTGNGIAGSCRYISECYNIGEVTGFSIVEGAYNSNYTLQGKGQESGNVKILTEAQMRTQNMYVGFDFENVWEIDPSSSYPYPQLKSNRQQRIEGMELVSVPTKTVYSQGDKIDVTGGTVKLIYEGGYTTTVVITESMLAEYDTTKTGSQDIIVQYGGQKASFPITVDDISITSVNITGESNNLQKGASMQLKATVKPENATTQTVTWSSSNTQVATVDATGKVTALQTGDTTITATASNGISGQYSIKVTAPCVSLTLNKESLAMYKGETATLTATLSPVDTTDTVSWKSSNANILTVDNNGQLTGCAAGEAKITATAGTVTTTCNVIVKQKMDDFYITGVVDKEYTGDSIEQKVEVTDGIVVLEEDKDYTISYIDNVDVGTAKVHIIGMKYYEGSIEKSFNIVKKSSMGSSSKPSDEDFSNPSNKNSSESSENSSSKPSVKKTAISKIKNVKKRKAKVTFKAVKGADGYEIRYSINFSMESSKIKNTKKTSYKISSLKKNRKYFVQVRAYVYDSGEKVYGKWSNRKDIEIKK